MTKHLGLNGRRRREAGMSLVETACAVAILAIAIAGLTNVAATTASLHETRLEKDTALRAVEKELSLVASSAFATIQATYNNAGFDVAQDGHGGAGLDALKGDADGKPGHVTVTAPTGDATKLLEVAVRVDWNSRHGPQSVERRVRLARLGTGP
jgi:Tfp pilus assembly protein PilV